MKKIITQRGYDLLIERISKQISRIKDVQAEKVIAYTVSGDGWHDNPGFNQLEQKEFRLSNELKELIRIKDSSVLWRKEERNMKFVEIGSIVEIRQYFLTSELTKKLTFEIVGHGESDFKSGRLAYDTPIGISLMQLQVGEKVQVLLPVGKVDITLVQFLEE